MQTIINDNITKTANLNASGLFKEFFTYNQETINSIQQKALEGKNIIRSIANLGVEFTENAIPMGTYKNASAVYSSYLVKRDINNVGGRYVNITSATDNNVVSDPDPNEKLIKVKNIEFASNTTPIPAELYARMVDMAKSIEVRTGLFMEYYIKLLSKHRQTNLEVMEYDLLKSFTTESYVVEDYATGTPVASNQKFTGSFLNITSPLSLTADEINAIPSDLYVGRARSIDEPIKIVAFCTKEMVRKLLSNIHQDTGFVAQHLISTISNRQLMEVMNKNELGNSDIEARMRILAERMGMEFEINGIRFITVQEHQEALLLNSTGDAFEIKFLMQDGLALVNILEPNPTQYHTNYLSAFGFKNTNRQVVKDIYGINMVQEIIDGTQTQKYIDTISVYSLACRDIVPNDLTKGGSLPLNNNAIFGSTAAINAKIAKAKQNFNTWAARVNIPLLTI